MPEAIEIRQVFKSRGLPVETYVERESGRYESLLVEALKTSGTVCLLTGASKTGKTTLYKRVTKDMGLTPLVVRCDVNLSTPEFWRKALEGISFGRTTATNQGYELGGEAEAKVGAKLGWAWLAGVLGELRLGVSAKMSESEIRERILAAPSAEHLVPVLKELPYILVVEDFHYLREGVQKNIFQQWKVFVDSEVSVIVVGTSHHAVDLAQANKDLVGRIKHIDTKVWSSTDLAKIVLQGFSHLRVSITPQMVKTIASESAGLPIVVQDVCLQLFLDKKIDAIGDKSLIPSFTTKDAYEALTNVAKTSYGTFEAIYHKLAVGPRKKARKYNTYEIVLTAFTLDPFTFSLDRHEIDTRIRKMPIKNDERPPSPSVDSMLNALAKFQRRDGIELLEWRPLEQKLYIVEPSFLYYLRWRENRKKPPTLSELLKSLLSDISQSTATAG